MLEIFVNNQLIDTTNEIKISIDKIVTEFKNPTKATGSYSYDFTIPLTNNNSRIFHNIADTQTVGKFKTYNISVYVDNIPAIEGTFEPIEVNRFPVPSVRGNISAQKAGRLGDILVDKKLREITSFEPVDFGGMSDIFTNINDDTLYVPVTSEIKHTYIAESFKQLLYGQSGWYYTDFGISHFIAGIVNNIFTDLEYTVSGEIFNNETFNRMMMLYSNSNGDPQAYNYGKLNPFEAYIPVEVSISQYSVYSESTRIERNSDYVYVFEPRYVAITGDLSNSLGSDGVYTAKYTGNYTLRYTSTAGIDSAPGTGQFVVFRCIDNNEFLPENQLPYGTGFNNTDAGNYITDLDTLNIGTGNTFTVKLVEGRQYRVQHYVSAPKTSSMLFYYDNTISNSFRCTACDGKQLLNPADFLPDMDQKEFLLGVFKLFNLYYTINVDTKEINLFTRDEFFTLNITNTLNLDRYCDLESFKDTPITDKERSEVFYKYAEDEGEYIIKKTDYLTQIGNTTYTDSNPLPFYPLSYFKVKIESTNTEQPYAVVPAIIPVTDTTDVRALSEEHRNSFSYGPRIGLYLGNKVYAESLKSDFTVSFTVQPTPAIMFTTFVSTYVGVQPFGSYSSPTPADYTYIPQFAFFDLTNQPAYEIVINSTRRDFEVKETTGETVFQILDNTKFLEDGVPDTLSLALIGEKSIFQQLYQNDLRITKYSNYCEGKIKMDSSLFDKLTGRNILLLNNDKYLLESIKGYQLGTNTATIRIYRIM